MGRINRLLDKLSEYLSQRKGLLPILGMLLVALNLVFKIYPGAGWLVETDLFLHLGVVVAILGFLIAWAL
jgi:hypothetical protein